jgi:hypothetical protein
MKTSISYLILSLSLACGARAATFSVTPNVVSNDYTGLITFHMSGLTPGETVQVVQYLDRNHNGVVDAADLAVRGETVSDGDPKLEAGATNIYVFRDEDGTSNGTITASYRFSLAPFGGDVVGSYLFRCSSPSNYFAATNLAFTVLSAPYAQTVQGTVSNNSTNIPYAIVGLLQNVVLAAGPPNIIAGGTADATGHYTLKAPVGTYLAVAIQPGYVGNLLAFPTVVLTSNATVTADITLIAATTSIHGSLLDATNSSVHAVPYAEMAFTTTNGFVTVALCDSNANFAVPVTPGIWTPGILPQSANAQSYLVPDAAASPQFDTRTAPVNFAIVWLKHSTALIYGRTVNNLGQPVPGVGLFLNADFGQYNAFVSSDSEGLYSAGIDAGAGTVSVQNLSDPTANQYIWPSPQFSIFDGQAISLNITGLVTTARFRSHVVDDTGTPLSGLQTAADSYQFYGAYTFATTDDNGYLDMPVFGGKWGFLILNPLAGLVFPDLRTFTITDGVNLTSDIIARTITGHVSGWVRDTANHGITNIPVTITNHVGSTNYTLTVNTDTSGNYSVGVFAGTWNVGLDSYSLESKGYIPVGATNVTVPPSNAVANFTIGSVPPPQILTTSLPDATTNVYYGGYLEYTNGSYPVFWSLAAGMLPGGLTLAEFGDISGYPTNLGLFSFTVKAQDSRGSNDVKVLSINVRQAPAGPLQITTTSLPNPAAGCAYSNQFQATGGVPPYSWALASGSDPLPAVLNLATNGILSGIPSAAGYASLLVEVTDTLGASVTASLYLSVNEALQYYPGPLPAGEVDNPYYGYPSVSGGGPTQIWSLLAGSLPPQLAFDPATGYITGTPNTVGIYNFTLRVTDGCVTVDIATAITNYPALQITTTTLPVAPFNVPYSAQLQAAGGAPPYYWYTYTQLPYGLTLNTDGSITGTPQTIETNTFTAYVYDRAGGSASVNLTLGTTTLPLLDLPAQPAPNQFSFRVTGQMGKSYTAQYSTDLMNWTDLYTTNAPANVFFVTDTNAVDPRRVYQLKVNP